MAKGDTLKYVEGAVAGIALSVAGGLFLNTKMGKEFKNTIENITADFYKYISSKVKKMEKMGEKEYKMFMKDAAEQYSKAKKIPADLAKQLVKNVQQSWRHFVN